MDIDSEPEEMEELAGPAKTGGRQKKAAKRKVRIH